MSGIVLPEAVNQPADFPERHCGLSLADEKEMAETLGLESPTDIRHSLPLDISEADFSGLPSALTEREAITELRRIVNNNTVAVSMIGRGYYGTDMPSVIRRQMLEDVSWYTSYTPYQAEISQGRLEMLLNFQTLTTELTGLPFANASLLDEATAAAEAMLLLWRESKNGECCLVDENLFPQTLAVLQTRAEPLGIKLAVMAAEEFTAHTTGAFAAIISYPGDDGRIRDWLPITTALNEFGISSICCCDLLALTLLKTPADNGFTIAVGSSQRFGVPLGFGGPHAAFFAFSEKLLHHIPGRLVGVSKDSTGRVAYRLSLQAREQHIRRDKATSNICTAQALPAMLATAYAIYHGPQRLINKAWRVHTMAMVLAQGLREMGQQILSDCFFDTVRIAADDAPGISQRIADNGINVLSLENGIIGVSTDELTTPQHVETIWRAFGAQIPDFNDVLPPSLAPEYLRTSSFCTHPVFNNYHSEQQMSRYLRRLAEKDIALNRSMIALGSCTMKLNGATEMTPLSWPLLADIHPFAPPGQSVGYQMLTTDLEKLLAELTGFAAVSLQPNAGAQGEYAGLLAIRNYLKDNGGENRNICLIPKSAHGTNPASAAMAGMHVVVLQTDSIGQVDISDLRLKIDEHQENLAALMLTYPSTCGAFGTGLPEICSMIHQAGGQIYLDGANFNAMVGLIKPGECGADVMHINLHKTFCIPHGGGGPGMGPIAVGKHLAPFLPSHPFLADDKQGGAVSAAPFGSALILVISWLYIRLMGADGLKRATLSALLSANYIACRLQEKFPVLYRNADGFVAHECIVDARQFKKIAGVSVEDIAKRLADFGFHAPTVSWPEAGAIMIEPTESESKEELDRFCSAMLAIEKEISRVIAGEWPKDDNPLINAPHVAEDLMNDNWEHPYSREQAAYPLLWVKKDKYWPPVSRIAAAFGDRNIKCSCPAVEDYLV